MAQEFKSKELDSELYKVVTTFSTYASAKGIKIEIEEEARDAKFIAYRVANEALGLAGHIGRHVNDRRIVYLVVDGGKLNWALSEGFSREEAFNKVGIYRYAASLNNFIQFILGEKNYKLDSEYIKV
jgi:hypothetical protein